MVKGFPNLPHFDSLRLCRPGESPPCDLATPNLADGQGFMRGPEACSSLKKERKTMKNTPKIYVACLASYNAGILHGEWVDLFDCDDLNESVQSMLRKSPVSDAEEYAIHDHEFCGSLSEYAGLDTVEALKEAFEKAESESVDWDLFCQFCEHKGHEIEADAVEKFNEAYAGAADSLVDWCHGFLDDTGQLEAIPENLRYYFDYEAFARDMEIGDVFTIRHECETHVFWNH